MGWGEPDKNEKYEDTENSISEQDLIYLRGLGLNEAQVTAVKSRVIINRRQGLPVNIQGLTIEDIRTYIPKADSTQEEA